MRTKGNDMALITSIRSRCSLCSRDKTIRAARNNPMKPKQMKFINEYLIDLNATQAAIRAGYSRKTAYSIGQENLKKPEIKQKIDSELGTLYDSQKNMLIVAAEAAIKALTDIVEHGRGSARVQAANSILDRAGHKSADKIPLNINSNIIASINTEDPRQALLDKFNRLDSQVDVSDG